MIILITHIITIIIIIIIISIIIITIVIISYELLRRPRGAAERLLGEVRPEQVYY